MKRKKPAGLVPDAFWKDEMPLVWFNDDGPRLKKGRYCVMKGCFVFARYNRKPDAELVIRRILSALDPAMMIVPVPVKKKPAKPKTNPNGHPYGCRCYPECDPSW